MKIAENISINLDLNTDGFSLKVKGANGLLRELKQSLNTVAESTTRTANHINSSSRGFRDFMINVSSARFAVLDFYDIFMRLPLSVVKSAGEIERMTKLMEGLSTAVDKVADAKKSRAFVFDMAQNAPYDVKTLTDSFVKLKAGGIDPTNGSMKALVDSVAKFGGTSEQLHRASIAIQQMSGKGVVSMEELRQQLGEAVPTAISMMATGMGMSMAKLVDAISKGQVQAKGALQRMFAVMQIDNADAAAKMMTTWEGMFAKLKTKWELFKFELAGGDSEVGAFSDAKKTLEEIIQLFETDKVRQFASDLASVVSGFAKAIKVAISFVIDFYSEIKIAGEVLLTAFAASKIISIFGGMKSALEGLSESYRKNAAEAVLSAEKKTVAQRSQIAQAIVGHRAEIAALNEKFAAETRLFGLNAQRVHLERAKAIQVEVGALRESIAKQRDVAAAITAGGASAASAAPRMAILRTAFSAMGGPITLLTALIYGAAEAWDHFANRAERAKKIAEDARNETATKEQEQTVADDLRKKKIQEGITVRQLESLEKKPGTQARRKEVEEELRQQREEIAQLEETHRRQLDVLYKRASNDRIRDNTQRLEIEKRENNNAIRLAREAENKQAEEDKKARLSKFKEGTEAYAKEEAKIAQEATARTRKYGKMQEHAELESIKAMSASKSRELDALISEGKGTSEKASLLRDQIADFDSKIGELTKPGRVSSDDLEGTMKLMAPKKKEGEAEKRDHIGSYNKYLLDAKDGIAEAKRKLADLGKEQSVLEALQRESNDRFQELAAGGQLTETVPGVKGKNGGKSTVRQIDPKTKEGQEKIKLLAEQDAARKAEELSVAALKRQITALADEESDLNQTTKLMGHEYEFANRKIIDINSAFEKERQGLSGIKLAEAEAVKNKRVFIAAEVASYDYLRNAKAEYEQAEVDLTFNAQERMRKQYELTTKKLHAEYEKRKQDEINAIDSMTATAEEKERAKAEAVARLDAAYELRRSTAANEYKEKSMSGIEQTMRGWNDIQQQLSSASTSWMQSFTDQFATMLTRSKADWRGFVIEVLKGLAKIALQKAIAGIATSVLGAFSGDATGGTANTGALTTTANAGPMTSTAQISANAADVNSAGLAGFANGGIMTEFGPAALRKYATGGIANSPQLALFGEGAMNEAFVPLPDGRSIPVTMSMPKVEAGSGESSQNVNISIVVNKDGEKEDAAGEDNAAWGKVAQKIKGIVQTELSVQQRPGGILYRR